MNQTSFLIEVVASDGAPTIIVRAQNGAIVKITTKPEEVSTFLLTVLESLQKVQVPNSNNTQTHE